jgi:hypothetical protein
VEVRMQKHEWVRRSRRRTGLVFVRRLEWIGRTE